MRVPGCAVLVLLGLAGCATTPAPAPVIGEAYAGPATLNLRQEIAPRSAVVAAVNHGERLEIVQQRRRFYRVRTPKGIEGWADERMLLSAGEVSELRRLAEESRSSPSQGVAASFDLLNVHTQPERQSPSFLQIKEGEKVDVIGRRLTPHDSPVARRIGVPAAKAAPVKTRSKKEKKKGKADLPAPPLPAPPPPPEDWAELSRPQATAAEPKAAPPDDWTLIRNAAGQVGWVLTRRLYMAIPVEVAQYAEGRRISSYFALGETRDGEETKKTWLWTTVEQGLQPHDFDSLRVFIWSVRRHRYETAYIERNLKGFFPVLLQPVDPPKQMRAKMTGKLPGFKVQIVKKDGRRYRRSYAYWDNKVRLSGDEPAPEPPPEPARAELPLLASARGEPAPPPESSWYGRVKQSVGDWRKRLFGR